MRINPENELREILSVTSWKKSISVVAILLFVLVGAQPTSAVAATLDGPNEVSKTDTVRFAASVDVKTADARLDSLTLTFYPMGGEDSVTVTLAPDGTVRRIDPPRGTVGRGKIRVGLLRRTLHVVPVDDPDSGYGYGYGYGTGNATYDVRVDTRAFKQGAYEVTLTAVCEGGASASDTTQFEVTLPNVAGERGGSGSGDASDRGRSRVHVGAADASVVWGE